MGKISLRCRSRRLTCRSLRRLQLSKMRIRLSHVAPVVSDEFETNAAPGSTFSDPTASFADLNEDESAPFATSATDFQEVDFSIVTTPDTPVVVDEAAPVDEGRHENVMRQELESVDFYIAQGYADIAVDTLEMLERQFGSHPDIQSRREKLAQRDQPVEEAAVFEFGGAEDIATATPVPEAITFDADSAYASLAGDGGGGNNVGAAKPVGRE